MCIMCGVATPERIFCESCWIKVPVEIRHWFWQRTDYGKRELTDGEVAELHRLLMVYPRSSQAHK
jgi:hypothetical protein